MLDPETKRAWHRLRKEMKDDVPILLRGLANPVKRLPIRLYSAVVRGCKSLTRRAKEWDFSPTGRRALVSQLSRVRLRSPIYKA